MFNSIFHNTVFYQKVIFIRKENFNDLPLIYLFNRKKNSRKHQRNRFFSSREFGRGNWAKTNFYQVLGVKNTSTGKEIKSAYYKLAKLYHPDMLSSNSQKEKKIAYEKFKNIQEAHEVLSNDHIRQEYDNFCLLEDQFNQDVFKCKNSYPKYKPFQNKKGSKHSDKNYERMRQRMYEEFFQRYPNTQRNSAQIMAIYRILNLFFGFLLITLILSFSHSRYNPSLIKFSEDEWILKNKRNLIKHSIDIKEDKIKLQNTDSKSEKQSRYLLVDHEPRKNIFLKV